MREWLGAPPGDTASRLAKLVWIRKMYLRSVLPSDALLAAVAVLVGSSALSVVVGVCIVVTLVGFATITMQLGRERS